MEKMEPRSIREIVLRTRWTAKDAKLIFDAWSESKLPATEFAGKHGFDAQRLYWWNRRLRREPLRETSPVAFAEVAVKPNAKIDAADSCLGIVLPCGIIVRVPAAFDENALRRVINLLRGAAGC